MSSSKEYRNEQFTEQHEDTSKLLYDDFNDRKDFDNVNMICDAKAFFRLFHMPLVTAGDSGALIKCSH